MIINKMKRTTSNENEEPTPPVPPLHEFPNEATTFLTQLSLAYVTKSVKGWGNVIGHSTIHEIKHYGIIKWFIIIY